MSTTRCWLACPTRQLLDVLSDKWVCLVFCVLMDGPARHSEIGRRIAGVSQKMLTQTLRSLEQDGFVTRTVTAEVPVRVDYELTALGRDFAPVMVAIKAWAEAHMDQVFAARGDVEVGLRGLTLLAYQDKCANQDRRQHHRADHVAQCHDEVVRARLEVRLVVRDVGCG